MSGPCQACGCHWCVCAPSDVIASTPARGEVPLPPGGFNVPAGDPFPARVERTGEDMEKCDDCGREAPEGAFVMGDGSGARYVCREGEGCCAPPKETTAVEAVEMWRRSANEWHTRALEQSALLATCEQERDELARKLEEEQERSDGYGAMCAEAEARADELARKLAEAIAKNVALTEAGQKAWHDGVYCERQIADRKIAALTEENGRLAARFAESRDEAANLIHAANEDARTYRERRDTAEADRDQLKAALREVAKCNDGLCSNCHRITRAALSAPAATGESEKA